MACYRRALALDPTNAWAHAALGALLLAIDDTEAAVASLGAAVALDATDANSLVSLGMAQIVLHRWQEAQQSFRGALALQPRDRATAQFNLGVALDGEGLHEQAVDAYTEGLGIEPSNADALRNLGAVFTKLDRMEEALVAYTRAVDADPDDAVSRHLVAAMRGDDTPRAPREYVRRVFDDYAHSYDTHLLDKLEYRAPDSIRALVDQLCAAPVETALDIGCGTGLVGVRLRDRVGVLHGVDLSSKMIARAEATGVYDALYIGDIVEFLQSSDALAYDLVTAADVLIYVGDLVELMRAVAARLAVAGRFVFTVESLDAGDYRLLDSGRYAHSADYIARLATDSHLTVLASEPLALRLQRDTRVNGRLFAVG